MSIIELAKKQPHRFEIRPYTLAPKLFAVYAEGTDLVLALGTTEKFALENFEQAAARFIRSEHMKVMPEMVGAR